MIRRSELLCTVRIAEDRMLKMGVMRANRKAAKYFDAVRRAYTAALMPYGADPAYRGLIIDGIN